MKLALNTESANALREFGQAMPIAVANIVASTHKICSVYLSVADMLGVHRQSFYDMLMLIKKAQECSAEAIEALPTLLNSTADKIDQYVVKQTLLEQKISAAGTSTGGITKVPSGKISIDENARIEYRPIEYVQLNQNGEIEHLQYDQPIYVDFDTVCTIPEGVLSFDDQKKAQSWAESEFRSWRERLTTEQEDSIKMYSGTTYGTINKQSRFIERETDGIEEISRNIDEALSQAHLPCDMLVYRGLSEDAVLDMARHAGGTLQSGSVINEMAFLSASMTPDTSFCNSSSSIMRLIAVEGLHGAPLIHGDLASVSNESEILFSRNHGILIQSVVRCPRSDIISGASDDIITVIDGILTLY